MKVDWKYQLQQYGAALVVAIPVFVSLSLYIFYRRGYYNLYIANKAFAGDAAILLGIIFIVLHFIMANFDIRCVTLCAPYQFTNS